MRGPFWIGRPGLEDALRKGRNVLLCDDPHALRSYVALAKFKAFEKAAERMAAGEPPEFLGLPNIGIPTNTRTRPAAARHSPAEGN